MPKVNVYATLDEALEDVARRSFYEDCIVTPLRDGTFRVEDDYGTIDTDQWELSHDDGFSWCSSAPMPEHSRLMEPCESFATAGHIRYHMSEVEDIESLGLPVAFAYVIVNDADFPWELSEDERFEQGFTDDDRTIGWALASRTIHPKDVHVSEWDAVATHPDEN